MIPAFLGPFVATPNADPAFALGMDGATRNPLGLIMQASDDTEWCWAAVAASVSAFFNPATAWTQPVIVSSCLHLNCNGKPIPNACNVASSLEQALKITGNLASPQVGRALTFPEVTAQINSGRPIGCHITWSRDQGHFNAIVGYDADSQDLDVVDPLYDDSSPPYDIFKASYQNSGTWDLSYLTV